MGFVDAGVECVTEGGKSSTDQSLLRYLALFCPTLSKDVGLGDNSNLNHRLHLPGATVSTAALLPPQRSLLPHRWVDLAEHTPNLAPLFWKAARFWLANKTYNSGCLKETMMHSERGVHPHSNMWVFTMKTTCVGVQEGALDLWMSFFFGFFSSRHWAEAHLHRERQG